MRTTLTRLLTTTVFTAALSGLTIMPGALRADDRVYHDKAHNDDHHWDNREDQAYRIWLKERHRKYEGFQRLKAEEQEQYWAWRHNHSDAELKINIR